MSRMSSSSNAEDNGAEGVKGTRVYAMGKRCSEKDVIRSCTACFCIVIMVIFHKHADSYFLNSNIHPSISIDSNE